MAKTDGGGKCFAFASCTFLHSCLVIVLFWPICRTAANGPIIADISVTNVTPVVQFGDSPLWDKDAQSVFYIDTTGKTVNRYHPYTKEFVSAEIQTADNVEFLVPLSEMVTMFLIGYGANIAQFVWDGTTTPIKHEMFMAIVNIIGEVISCAKADSDKRLWVGTSYPATNQSGLLGRLYIVNESGNATMRLDGIGTPTGLTWNPDNNKLYYVDSLNANIVCHSYSMVEGDLLDEGTVFFNFTANNVQGVPNGITVDNEGNLWVACLQSSHVLKIDPTGIFLTKVDLPAACDITNVAFGGPTLEDLYVTTAEEPKKPESGALFCVSGTGSTGIDGMGTKMQKPPDNVLDDGTHLPHENDLDTGVMMPQVMGMDNTLQ